MKSPYLNTISVSLLFLTQSVFSQTIFKIDIKKAHKYEVFSNDFLQLVLDKTNLTYMYTYIEPRTGDTATELFSEGTFSLCKGTLILQTSVCKKNCSIFKNLTGLRFVLRRKKISPLPNQENISDEYYYFSQELKRSDFQHNEKLKYERE